MVLSSYSKSQSSVSFISFLLYIAAATTILTTQSNRSNSLVEAFVPQKFVGGASILSQSVSLTSSLSMSSLLSTVSSSLSSSSSSSSSSSPTKAKSTTQTLAATTITTTSHPDHLKNVFVVPSHHVPDDDDDILSSIATTAPPLPSSIVSQNQNQEKKKKKLWYHQDNDSLESKLIVAVCSYHLIKLMIDTMNCTSSILNMIVGVSGLLLCAFVVINQRKSSIAPLTTESNSLCATGFIKVYSVDHHDDKCGVTCMKEEDFVWFKPFEMGLTIAGLVINPCQVAGYDTFVEVVTHGLTYEPFVLQATLNMYDPAKKE